VDSKAVAERIRAFNRFYTETIGALNERHEGLSISLLQSRMLYRIATTETAQVTHLARSLRLDLPHASRVLGGLEDRRLIRRTQSQRDRRQRIVELTATGKRLLHRIEQRSNKRALAITAGLSEADLAELFDAMDTITHLLVDKEHP
jgi:DNA-binding MarR family transcriptional regulator